ncbi:MAG: response regulator transcription factor [Lachnospiraceae bacterium]|jgi:two-component system alkaline phosphatase synthesis response regulator PhoP|nr:response regulator transcription factor [Lachnospiraceae bacterium]
MPLVYIVEDDANIREIESFALKNSGFAVEAFACAKDFYNGLLKRPPDLVLLDIMLPDEDGLIVLGKLRSGAGTRKLPVILVTAKTTEVDKVKGLDGGADDYMTKPFGVLELISRVKALLRRSTQDSAAEELSVGEITLDMARRAAYVAGKPCGLTYKEFELLHLLLVNAGIVLKRDLLMERIWGIDFEGESRTLDMHIGTLRRKLGESGVHIKTVRNVGYMME